MNVSEQRVLPHLIHVDVAWCVPAIAPPTPLAIDVKPAQLLPTATLPSALEPVQYWVTDMPADAGVAVRLPASAAACGRWVSGGCAGAARAGCGQRGGGCTVRA